MGEYNPKSKRSLPVSWRGIQRKLPRTLSTFQIVILAGFLSLLVLRSTIGLGNFGSLYTAPAHEYVKNVRSMLLDDKAAVDVEHKRTLVQTDDAEPVDKLQKNGHKNALQESEDEMDADVAEVKAVTAKDVKNGKEKGIEKKKPISKPKEVGVAENFDQVEAQLGEEEAADELSDFEKFEKGEEEEKASSTKANAVVEQNLPTKENSVRKEAERKSSVEKKEEETKSEEVQMAGELKPNNNEYFEMSPERLKEFTEQVMANMSRITRRDDPDAFTLGPKISDWDEQRASWLEKNPDMKTADPHKPKVLLLTGSQPWPCNSPVGDHYLLKMIKNKVDYARIHNMEIFYSFAHLEKQMSHFWAKLPLIRKMMLMRPEVEWIFWMDSDAVFTDMVFEIPFEKYQDYNFFMWGWEEGLFTKRSWVSCNTGVMFLRNNQWTLDLLDIWVHMGPFGEMRMEAGKLLSHYLTSRPAMMADDQSALVYLMLTRPELRSKIYLEDEYYLSGYWVSLVGKYEEFEKTSRPGAGGRNWPFTTHFTGCQPCSGENNEIYGGSSCIDGMERAFNFADNQVLRPFGFAHEGLEGSKVTRIRNETTKPVWSVPVDNPWSVQSFYD